MISRANVLKYSYLCSWLLYALTIILIDWTNATSLSSAIGVLGIGGTIAAAVLQMKATKWHAGGALISLGLVLAYLFWWGTQIVGRYQADPTQGALRELWLQLRMWISMFDARLTRSGAVEAALEGYWQFGMAAIQCVFLVILIGSIRGSREVGASAGAN